MEVLIIEDEELTANYLRSILEAENFTVSLSDNVDNNLCKKFIHLFDLLVFDLNLHGMTALDFVRNARKNSPDIPIIIVSDETKTRTKIELLNLGVDDYIAKPFDKHELIARIKTVLRRSLNVSFEQHIEYGDLAFSLKDRILRLGKKIIHLTRTEAQVFKLLVLNHDQVVSISDLLIKVWNMTPGFQSNIVEVTINRLRKKIDKKNKERLIKNIHGSGYFLDLSK
ncbi:response regulator [Candidatus Peregrinibacteria bacterium]|nr:response regulator [Candidatus Peregrinibacteria bacterium]